MPALSRVQPDRCAYCGLQFEDISEHFIEMLTRRDAMITTMSTAVISLEPEGTYLFRSELVARCDETGTFIIPYSPSKFDRHCPDQSCEPFSLTGHLLRKRRMWICNVCTCGIALTEHRTRPVVCHCLLLDGQGDHGMPMDCFGAVNEDAVKLARAIRAAL